MIPFAFLNKRFKWLGAALYLAGYGIYSYAQPNVMSVKDGTGLLVQVMVLAGLLMIICSKQNTEDEYINHVRLISLQWAVLLFIALRLWWKLMGYVTSDESWMPQWQVNSMLLFYLVFFYYQTFFKERVMSIIHSNREK
ncbi:MAG: hypothetical protein IT236_07285 [Bacteroidia bacterium]|nr:hypothetical protein [Bacteroidia bacterium]